jgi:lauroyl/myristoyl acyltransferase/tetraacyldisaccharide-1-P 4'-kinase
VSVLLRPAELLYRGINRGRRALYRAGVLRAKRLHRPVISIGNLGAGGAGKTPAVIALCRYLESQGLRVAVLTRGYGRGDPSYTGSVTSLDADKYGDEPVLIKRSIAGDVLVGANRYANARNYDCDVFVLDDGFQHLQLHRDLDIVIDAPARFYREGRGALRDADIVIPRRLRTLVPESLRGQRVFAFAGLADNPQFFASLVEAGLQLAGTKGFRDHHRYSQADLDEIRRDAKGAPVVTSEKDAVKIEDPAIIAVGAELVIEQEVLDEALRVASGELREQLGPGDEESRAAIGDSGGLDDSGDTARGTRNSQPATKRKRRKHPLVERAEYIAARAVTRLVASMSEEAVYRWGTRVGALAGKVIRRRDRLGMRNLRATFPDRDERELRKILDESWRHFGRELFQYLRLQNASEEELLEACPIVNQELVTEAIARGKGTMLVSGHWGGWEIGGLVVMSLLRNVKTVARPLDNALLERDLQRMREKTGTEVVDRRRAGRLLMRGLAENGVILLLVDQAVQPKEGVLVPFLGRPAWTTPAPAKMALRTGATIVFGFCNADGLRHRLEFTEAIRADLLSGDERDPVNLTTRINELISARITARPELWLWMHDRWKGTGESEATNGV